VASSARGRLTGSGKAILEGKDMKVKLASTGYTEAGFQELLKTLENELGR
jgi:hypothetical protein